MVPAGTFGQTQGRPVLGHVVKNDRGDCCSKPSASRVLSLGPGSQSILGARCPSLQSHRAGGHLPATTSGSIWLRSTGNASPCPNPPPAPAPHHSPDQLCPSGHQTCLRSRGPSLPVSSAWKVLTDIRGRQLTGTGFKHKALDTDDTAALHFLPKQGWGGHLLLSAGKPYMNTPIWGAKEGAQLLGGPGPWCRFSWPTPALGLLEAAHDPWPQVGATSGDI